MNKEFSTLHKLELRLVLKILIPLYRTITKEQSLTLSIQLYNPREVIRKKNTRGDLFALAEYEITRIQTQTARFLSLQICRNKVIKVLGAFGDAEIWTMNEDCILIKTLTTVST